MASLPITELNERARDIFRRVVEGYISSGQPVGSKTLAGVSGLNLSPASIRSVLADLEQLGLLAAPHTSAGRMPTEVGLRLFVDGMMQVAEPTREERAAIEQRLSAPGPIEAALEATSAVLSDLSACAGVIMVPRREPKLGLDVRVVPLGGTLAQQGGSDLAAPVLGGYDDRQEGPAVGVLHGVHGAKIKSSKINFYCDSLADTKYWCQVKGLWTIPVLDSLDLKRPRPWRTRGRPR